MAFDTWIKRVNGQTAAGFFVTVRLLLFLFMPYSTFLGFGDQLNFFRLVQLPGWPFFQYWVEFPPFFPLLSASLYRIAAGDENVYCYLLAGILTAFDAGSILIFSLLLKKLESIRTGALRLVIYTTVLCFFPYGWWYFDPIVVFFLLISLWFVLQQKTIGAGLAIAGGFLWKLFPVLALILAWMTMTSRKFLKVSLLLFTCIFIAMGILYIASPQMTVSSLSAQYSKGSWQTVWALLDGNEGTGNFGPLTDRLDASMAFRQTRNAPVVPPLIPLAAAGIAGLLILRFTGRKPGPTAALAVTGAAWVLLILASPGWSPQWVLYIIPIILLVLPLNQAVLFLALYVCLSLAEWPLLFSRGRDDLIWIVIVLRTLTTLGLGVVFLSGAMNNQINRHISPEKSGAVGKKSDEL